MIIQGSSWARYGWKFLQRLTKNLRLEVSGAALSQPNPSTGFATNQRTTSVPVPLFSNFHRHAKDATPTGFCENEAKNRQRYISQTHFLSNIPKLASSHILRLRDFARRHRRALLIAAFVLVGFVTINVGAALAFHQNVEINGVRVETDKEVYRIGEGVKIRIYFVNNFQEPTDACPDRYDLTVAGMLRPVYGHIAIIETSGHCPIVNPGGERFEGTDEWRALIPGSFTIEVTEYYPKLNDSFIGRTSILVLAL